MIITLIGNFNVDYSTESHWAWTYEHLGHTVHRCQENETTTEQIWDLARHSDLVHYTHTHGWHTPGTMTISDLLDLCRTHHITTVGIHLDYWRGLAREKDVGTHPWWTCDYIFTADGGSDQWYRDQGINHHYLMAGVIESECYLGTPRPEYECDVAFVGAYDYHPEHSYRPQLIDWLTQNYGGRFRRFGNNTPTGVIRGKDLNDLYASAKVIIGDTLCIGFDHPDYFSDRLFETTGRGGFLIFPHIEGIDDCFVTDLSGSFQSQIELVEYEYENFGQLRRQIDRYLADDTAREAIRHAGHRRTKRCHTYTNRALQMLDTITPEEIANDTPA